MLRRARTRRTLLTMLLVGLHLLGHVRPSIAAIRRVGSRCALALAALLTTLALAARANLRVVSHTTDRDGLVLTRCL